MVQGKPEVSPDGRTRVEWGYTQGRMSHEIFSPKLIDVETGQVLLDLIDDHEPWDGWVEWLPGGDCQVSIRHYYEGGKVGLGVRLFRDNGTFSIDGGAEEPLASIRRRLFRAFHDKTMQINPPTPGSWEEEWLNDLLKK